MMKGHTLVAILLLIIIASCDKEIDSDSIDCICTQVGCFQQNIDDTTNVNAILEFWADSMFFGNSNAKVVSVYIINKNTSLIDSISKEFESGSSQTYSMKLKETEFGSLTDFRKSKIVMSNKTLGIADTIDNISYVPRLESVVCNECSSPCDDQFTNVVFIRNVQLEYNGALQDSSIVILQ